MGKCFMVDLKTARNRQRTDALLHPPAFGQKDEALGELWSFDNFDHPICCRLHRFDEAPLVAAVDHHCLDSGTQPY